jgi:argininosuccinate synthase
MSKMQNKMESKVESKTANKAGSTKEKVVLAYSGGLDTSIIISWLIENYDYEVIAVVGDVGQGGDMMAVQEKALKTGASKVYIADLKEEFIKDYVFPNIKANAVYEGKYLLGTAFARPVIAKKLVEIALQENATTIVHGCTGKGNDQVRFELGIKALAPQLKVIAPWRTWEIKSREDAIDYAAKRGIPIPVTKEDNYSRDGNLWHLSHEGSDIEDPWNEPNLEKLLQMSVTPEKAPDSAEYLEIYFDKGIPTKINNKEYGPVELVEELNKIGGKNAVGIISLVENRLVGMKSRGVYETPGGTILYAAHKELETICLDRETSHYKELIACKFAELLYFGQWFTPLREALSAFVDSTQQNVTGTVKMKLYKGSCNAVAVKSIYSLYDEELSTFGEDTVYDQMDSQGFINLFGLPLKVNAQMLQKLKKKEEEQTHETMGRAI